MATAIRVERGLLQRSLARVQTAPPSAWLVVAFAAIVGFAVLYPMVMLLYGSFTPALGQADRGLTLDGYRVIATDSASREAMVTSLWLAAVRSGLAVALAVFIAWAITRTDMPGRNFFHNLMLLSFFLPALPLITSWVLLLAPNSGMINVALRNLFGFDKGPLNIFSYGGLIFLGTIGFSGFIYLLIAPAFRAVDSSLEDSARMAGASTLTVLRRITAPLLLPAILGAWSLAFVRSVESFEVEQLLGTQAGIYVFTTQIFHYIRGETLPQFGPAIAMSTVLIVMTAFIVVLQLRVLGRRSFVTVSGRGYQAKVTRMGNWRWVLFAFFVVLFSIKLALPLAVLVLGSFQRNAGFFGVDTFTLRHWAFLGTPVVWSSLKNTILVGLVSATVGVLIVTLISYIVVKTKYSVRTSLEFFSWVPYTVPSFVLSIGFLWAVLNGIPLFSNLYQTLWVIMIVFVIRGLPIGTRIMNGTIIQLSNELEEAGRIAGASWVYTFRRVVLPLLRPALAIGWLIFMITVIRDVSTVVLLYGAKSRTLAITYFEFQGAGEYEKAAAIGLLMTVLGMVFVFGIRLMDRLSSGSGARGGYGV